MNILSPNL